MSVWEYQAHARDLQTVWSDNCPFCKSGLRTILKEVHDTRRDSPGSLSNNRDGIRRVERCPVCGWWKASDIEQIEISGRGHDRIETRWGAAGSLRELDLEDLGTPLEEVRDFLSARYDRRLSLNPELLERTVADVFRSLGYRAIVTAYSGDDGIDVILEKDGLNIGVQVKRYKNSIEVEQIRSLAGALVLSGRTHGIFVTTSSFQSGATDTVQRFAIRGYKIELLDANRFYDALRLAQQRVERDVDPQSYLSHLRRLTEVEIIF